TVVLEETGMDAAALAQRLKRSGIETRPFFLGMHEQPVFHQRGLFVDERYPVTERLGRQGLYLPSGLALTEEQLARVCTVLHEVLACLCSVTSTRTAMTCSTVTRITLRSATWWRPCSGNTATARSSASSISDAEPAATHCPYPAVATTSPASIVLKACCFRHGKSRPSPATTEH